MTLQEPNSNLSTNKNYGFFSPESKKNSSDKFNALINSQSPSTQNNGNKGYSPFVIRTGNCSTLSNKMNSLSDRKIRKMSGSVYSPSPNTAKTDKLSDRFIPSNKGINLMEKFNMAKAYDDQIDENFNLANIDNSAMENNFKYNEILKQNFLNENINSLSFNNNFSKENPGGFNMMPNKIFSFKQDKKPKGSFLEDMLNRTAYNDNNSTESLRKVNTKPYKILKAPQLLDDFYLNLLDWSVRNDIAVGLANKVTLWCTNQTQQSVLFSYEEEQGKYVSSLIWSNEGQQLAVGTSTGTVDIFDGKYIKYILTIYYS